MCNSLSNAVHHADIKMRKRIAAIVDDDEITSAIMAEFCRRHEYEPMIYRSGVDAIFGLYDRRPDVLITDVHMPNLGGDILLWHLIDPPYVFQDVPIAIFTGDQSYTPKTEHGELNIQVFFKQDGLAKLGHFLDELKGAALNERPARHTSEMN